MKISNHFQIQNFKDSYYFQIQKFQVEYMRPSACNSVRSVQVLIINISQVLATVREPRRGWNTRASERSPSPGRRANAGTVKALTVTFKRNVSPTSPTVRRDSPVTTAVTRMVNQRDRGVTPPTSLPDGSIATWLCVRIAA